MSRRILLSTAILFAIAFVGFAEKKEEEEAVVVTDTADGNKEETTEEEAVATEEKEEAVKEAVEKVEEAPAQDIETEKEEATDEAIENVAEAETAPVAETEKAKTEEIEPAEEVEAGTEEQKQEPTEEKSSIARALILWLPNRLIDLTDIISMEGGVGSEMALEANLTKYFGFGGSFGEKYFIQKAYAKQLGGGYSSGWGLQTLWMNTEKRNIEDTFGSTKRCYVNRKDYSVADYHNHSYTDKVRDFWAVGVKAGWLAIVGVEIHPTEIADFVAGIFFMDIYSDDIK